MYNTRVRTHILSLSISISFLLSVNIVQCVFNSHATKLLIWSLLCTHDRNRWQFSGVKVHITIYCCMIITYIVHTLTHTHIHTFHCKYEEFYRIVLPYSLKCESIRLVFSLFVAFAAQKSGKICRQHCNNWINIWIADWCLNMHSTHTHFNVIVLVVFLIYVSQVYPVYRCTCPCTVSRSHYCTYLEHSIDNSVNVTVAFNISHFQFNNLNWTKNNMLCMFCMYIFPDRLHKYPLI